MRHLLFFLVLIFPSLIAADFLEDRHILYNRSRAPAKWMNLGRAPEDSMITFFIALKQRNVKELETILEKVSHPRSPNYGEHLTYQQVLDIVAPPVQDHDVVVNWVISEGIPRENIISRRDSLEIRGNVSTVERMFRTTMYVFKREQKNRKIIAHLGHSSIPKHVHQYIDMVSGLSLFPPIRRNRPQQDNLQQDQSAWTIAPHLRKVYNIPSGLRATNPKTTQAAVEFEWPGCFTYDDMRYYSSLVEMPFTNITRLIPSPSNWYNEGCDAETAMDLQLMSNVGSGANTWAFTNEFWIYEFTQTLISLNDPPLVTSLSWGWMEADQCDSITHAECSTLGVDSRGYVSRTNIELLKAGVMGLSVIVCTQDEGAPSDTNDECSLDNTQPVWPIYPASSPWVTSVGATTIIQGTLRAENSELNIPEEPEVAVPPACQQYPCNNGTSEKVAMSPDQDTLFTSGGGFSNYTSRPAYQSTAVLSYLKSHGLRPPADKFGVNNRGYPDISTAGSKTLIVLANYPQWNGGTSASTPTFAGIVSLLNDYRLNNGKKPLGFLNYVLYDMGAHYPQAYHFITEGNNTCTGWELNTCCKYGYSAIAGWNPAVGFGTPNFQAMLKYISQLP